MALAFAASACAHAPAEPVGPSRSDTGAISITDTELRNRIDALLEAFERLREWEATR